MRTKIQTIGSFHVNFCKIDVSVWAEILEDNVFIIVSYINYKVIVIRCFNRKVLNKNFPYFEKKFIRRVVQIKVFTNKINFTLLAIGKNFICQMSVYDNCILQHCMFFFKNFIEMKTKINAVTLYYVKSIPIEYILRIYIHITNFFFTTKKWH